jgi:hypothetical protein
MAIANTHERMRPVSPMLTQSETAPMVQKRVFWPIAPSTRAMPKTESRICWWMPNSMVWFGPAGAGRVPHA